MSDTQNLHLVRGRFLTSCGVAAWAATLFCGAACPRLIAQVGSQPAVVSETARQPQRAGEKLAFEVATIKPSAPDSSQQANFTLGPGDTYANTGGRFLAKSISLLDYIRFAYKLTDGQVEVLQATAPGWITSARFDIQAKSENTNPTKDQMRLMMQSLLADRFRLRVHSETRQMEVLRLTLVTPGKLGPQLRPHPAADDKCTNIVASTSRDSLQERASDVPAVCGGLVTVGVPGSPARVRIGGRRVPLALLAAQLGQMGGFNRPIVDQTALGGTFDLVLEWGPDSSEVPRDESRQVYILNALKDQLGLKLERKRSPVEALLVDKVSRDPTEN